MLRSRIDLVGRPRFIAVLISAAALTTFGVLPSAASAHHHHRHHGLRFGFAKPAPATVTISSANSVVDNFGPASVTVTRTGSTKKALTVTLNTADGTAVAGTDYTSGPYAVTIPKGQTSTTVSIDINDDETAGATKAFSVSLSNPSTRIALGSPQDVTIIGDDQSGSFTVPDGDTISLTGSLAGCDQLEFALVNLSDHSVLTQSGAPSGGCNTGTFFNGTYPNGTGSDVSVGVQLIDTSCANATYESDDLYMDPYSSGWATGDHNAIWTDLEGTTHIAITDAASCSYPVNREPNATDPGNLTGTITISPTSG